MSERTDQSHDPSPVSAAHGSERRDPRLRPPDPAGTRPKVDPEALRPTGDYRALPAGGPTERPPEPGSEQLRAPGSPNGGGERLPEPAHRAAPPARTGAPGHAPRFQFLFGAMGALGVAALALAASLALRPAPGPGVPWSAWKPTGSGGDPAQQIAEHVAPEYRLSATRQLVAITGGPQAIGGQPVVVALRNSGSSPTPLPENGVFYQLCGEGPNCSIPGKPSIQRGLLVRREALELALYTFRYVSSASQVIVTFPPPPPTSTPSKPKSASGASTSASSSPSTGSSGFSTQAPNRVLLFRPSDLATELSKPLDATLLGLAPTVSTMSAAPEAHLVDQLTANLLYDSILIPQQQSSAVLLLQPPSIGG